MYTWSRGIPRIKEVHEKIKKRKGEEGTRRKGEPSQPPRDPMHGPPFLIGILLAQPDLSKVRFIRRLYLPPAIRIATRANLPYCLCLSIGNPHSHSPIPATVRSGLFP